MSRKKICIPRLDMKVDWNNPNEDARNIVTIVQPAWTGKNIEVKVLSGGFVNLMLACSVKEDKNILIVRVFKTGSEVFSNRESELISLCLSAEMGAGQRVHVTFKNGLVMDYAPGARPKYRELSNPKFMRALGKCMAKLHSVDTDKFEIYDGDRKLQIPTNSRMFDQIDKFIDQIPDLSNKPERQQRMLVFIGSREKLQCEASLLRQHIEDLHLDVVWCHNDTYLFNIIYDENTESVCLIDHEFGGPNYAHIDTARNFSDISTWKMSGVAEKEDTYPSPVAIKEMLKEYLHTKHLLKNVSDEVTEEDVERSYTLLQKFRLVSEFWWGCFALAHLESGLVAFDLMLMAEVFLTAYWKNRTIIFPE